VLLIFIIRFIIYYYITHGDSKKKSQAESDKLQKQWLEEEKLFNDGKKRDGESRIMIKNGSDGLVMFFQEEERKSISDREFVVLVF
jgi:hypothetical protein